MLRRLHRLRAFTRRLSRDRRGATAVEFALISVPMLILFLGLVELGMILLVSVTLETATEFTARDIRTGVFQMSGSNTRDDYKGKVCRNMSWLSGLCQTNLFVEAETFNTFAGAGGSTPAATEPVDPDAVCWSVGNPEDIVLVRTYFKWPIVTPLLKPMLMTASDGSRLLSTAKVFRNEPFNPAQRARGAGC
jgi:Flp pilus assembly protein TadG